MVRFQSKIKFGEADGCDEWMAAKVKGYGIFWIKGKNRYAHRVSWEMTNGPIPVGLFVLHKCDNPKCVKPTHLFLGDTMVNMADMIQKGRKRVCSGDNHWVRKYPERLKRGDDSFSRTNPHRLCRGESHGRSVLKEADVLLVRELNRQGASYSEIARRFGVGRYAIGAIVRRKTWRHIA